MNDNCIDSENIQHDGPWYIMNVIFSPLEAGFSFEHLSWLTSDMTSLRFTKRVRAWGPLRFMVNPQFESKLMRIKVREGTTSIYKDMTAGR